MLLLLPLWNLRFRKSRLELIFESLDYRTAVINEVTNILCNRSSEMVVSRYY